MELAADFLALFLLRGEKLARQKPQLFLHALGLRQQLAVVLLTFSERTLDRLAPRNFLFEAAVGDDQAFTAQAKRAIKLAQVQVDFEGGAMRSEEHTSELQSRLHLVCRLL